MCTDKDRWNILKEEMDKILVDLSDIGFAIEFSKIWNQIEAEGDRLQEELNFIHREYGGALSDSLTRDALILKIASLEQKLKVLEGL